MASYLKASIERSYAESFLAELERNENQYFFFIGKGTTWANENSPDSYSDTVKSEYQVMNDIIGYKKLNPENILFALPKYTWTANTVYDEYDDNLELFDDANPSIFYVVTDENHIFKCISNNNGAASTQKPSSLLTKPFNTSDGYTWQYISTVRESDLPYELTDYIPVEFARSQSDTETQNQYNTQLSAVNASVTKIVTTNSSGASAGVYPYSIFNTSENAQSIVLSVSDVDPVSSDPSKNIVKIQDSTSVTKLRNLTLNASDFVGYIIRVAYSSQYPSEVDNYGFITAAEYIGENTAAFTVQSDVIDFSLTPSVDGNLASVEILPYIKIVGDGIGAYALPVMDANQRIQSVRVIRNGLNYSKVSASVTTPVTAITNHPVLRAVLSPKGGHASNILKELNVKDVLIVISVTENDAAKIIQGGSYRQFGIIKNPLLTYESGAVAGRQNLNYRDITLRAENGTVDSNHFTVGGGANMIIGTETYSAAKYVDIKSSTDSQITLKVINSTGNFITRQDRISDYIISLPESEFATDFRDNETVIQVIPPGIAVGSVTYGHTINVRGKVVDRQLNKLTIRLVSEGNFIAGRTLQGLVSGKQANVISLTSRNGELVWVTNTQQPTNTSSFLTSSNNQNLYRIVDSGLPYFDTENTPSYSGLHLLSLSTSVNSSTGAMDTTSSPLTQNTFVTGDVVHQGSTGTIGNYATGVVYKWDFINPARGNLYLTDVLGTFKNVVDNGITGSQLNTYIVAGVTLPEIEKTSGEVLYIDNVRPIQRNIAQREEFRLRLGF